MACRIEKSLSPKNQDICGKSKTKKLILNMISETWNKNIGIDDIRNNTKPNFINLLFFVVR